jgi:membrane protease YdiL (CAAX protease family)
MKACEYCGRENEGLSLSCKECGTAFAQPIPPVLEAAETETPVTLRAGSATLIFGIYLLGQVGGGVLGTIITMLLMRQRFNLGIANSADVSAQQFPWPIIAFGFLGGAATMFALCYGRFRSQFADTSPTGPAWVLGQRKHLLQGLGFGILLGSAYIALSYFVESEADDNTLGPLAQMAFGEGVEKLVWLGLALSAAFIEEPLFRGIFYGGYRASFGPVVAAIATSLLFWALHLMEMQGSWQAMLAIGSLGIATLWMRLRATAIGPAIALHFGYNGTMAVYTFWAMANQQPG